MKKLSLAVRFLIVVMAALSLLACGGGGGSGGGSGDGTLPTEPPEDLPLAVLTHPSPLYCGIGGTGDPIRFVFTRSMDTNPELYIVSEVFGTVPVNHGWSTTIRENDTLTFTPDGGEWNVGSDLVYIYATDADGSEIEVYYTVRIASSPVLYYVKADGTDSEAEGAGTTPGTAFATIPFAVSMVGEAPATILVAASTQPIGGTINPADSGNPYQGYSVGESTLNMANSVSLCGGFNAAFTERDPLKHPTLIASTIAGGGGEGIESVVTTIAADASVTSGTVLEGFTIVAPGEDTVDTEAFATGYTGALRVGGGEGEGGGLQVRNTRFIAGQSNLSVLATVQGNGGVTGAQSMWSNTALISSQTPGAESYGLYIDNAAPVFASGIVDGGRVGVSLTYSGFSADTWFAVSDSQIVAGAPGEGTNHGVIVTGGGIDMYLVRNWISGGGPAATVYGVKADMGGDGGTFYIDDNTVIGGLSTDSSVAIDVSGGGEGGESEPEGRVEITRNGILADSATGEDSTANGIRDGARSTLIEDNRISGGSSDAGSTGIDASGTGSKTYVRNTIVGAMGGANGFGIYLANETVNALVRANVISGCGTTAGTQVQSCSGIYDLGSGTKIIRNTVNGGSAMTVAADASIALYSGEGATGTTVRGNLFFTSPGGSLATTGTIGQCVLVEDSANFAAFEDNDLFACPSRYFDNSLGETGEEVGFDDPIFGESVSLSSEGNLENVDPGFVSNGANPGNTWSSDVNWRLTAGSSEFVRRGAAACPGFVDRDGTTYFNEPNSDNPARSAMGAFVSPTQSGNLSCP